MVIGIDIRALQSPHPTGVAEYTRELLEHIFRLDTENRYYLFVSGAKPITLPTFVFPNVKVVRCRWPNKLLHAAIRLFGAPKIDRIIAQAAGVQGLDLYFSPNLHFTALSKTCPYLLTIHDLSLWHFPYLYTDKQRLKQFLIEPDKQLRCANTIIVPSESTKRDLVALGIAETKISVLYPGLASDFQKPTTPLPPGIPPRFILALATNEPRKNFLATLTAFESYRARNPSAPVVLVLAGAPGWKNSTFKKRLATSPARADIHVLEYVTPEVKRALYRAARVVVYPSLYEGFGFPVLEALSSGTPVITSMRSSLGEVGGKAAYYVDPNHPLEITEGFEKLINDSPLRTELQKNGLALAEKFSWEQAARGWLTLAEALRKRDE